MSEKNVVRRSKIRRECWTWSENEGDAPWADDARPCTRAIDVGEQYMSSTIFPGHDSGFADGYYRRHTELIGGKWITVRTWVDGKPITSAFCLLCANRWTNLRQSMPESLRHAHEASV